jgi:hypothetical protein
MGEFNYEKEPAGLGKREMRAMVTLENGARYEGEW